MNRADYEREFNTLSRYGLSAAVSYLVDVALFAILEHFLLPAMGDEAIIAATVAARVLSSLFNYFANSRFVFKNYTRTSIVKYYALAAFQMAVSASAVYGLNLIFASLNDIIIKIAVDLVIFFVNYIVQKKWIFR